jgi:CheY-like chemotaxis protein
MRPDRWVAGKRSAGGIMDGARVDPVPGLRILLVEPDPIDAAVLVQVIRASQGTPDIATAANFSAAVEVLAREAFDTIFCSVAPEDVELFRSLVRTAKPRPVVALVTAAEGEIRKRAIQAGAIYTVCKAGLLSSFARRLVQAHGRAPTECRLVREDSSA